MDVSRDLKIEMLKAVRGHLESKLRGKRSVQLSGDAFFDKEIGLFVTLNINGGLRGCIGHIVGHRPLRESLFELAEAAAFNDPRFLALDEKDLDRVDLEISLLSEPAAVDDWQKILIGTHGILIKKGWAQAVFLPQVAVEQAWDLETTLKNLCRKAGLPADAYLEADMEFNVFTAAVFSENGLGIS